MKLAVIIPMYNEQAHAEKCVREVASVLRGSLPSSLLYVVNDGSSDATHSILIGLTNEEPVLRYLKHEVNQGYGAALLSGVHQALRDGFEFGLFMDSDLTNDPKLIPVFADKIKDNSFDLVKASRYIPNGAMQGVPFFRRLVSTIGNKVASLLFGMGVRDCTNGFRAVRLSMLSRLKFRERGFPMIVEELYLLKKMKARVTEIPYVLTAREDDCKSKFQYRPTTFYRYFVHALKAVFV